jgi:chromosome partitioning protein
MIVVVIASQKGGSGKTTLCGHLAVEAEATGAGPVALIDTDPQGSLAQWWNAREAKAPHFAKVSVLELRQALQHLSEIGFKLAIIDTPPAITLSIAQVIQHADLVVVPTRPSPHDLRAVGATADMAERSKKPLVFVVNGATQRARITGEAAVALSQHGVVAPAILHHRVDFAASMVDGRTVGEVLPKSPSAREVSELWAYLQDRLARIVKVPDLIPDATRERFSLAGLSALDASEDAAEEPEDEMPVIAAPAAPQTTETPPQPAMIEAAPERRDGTADRRDARRTTLFSGPERRFNPFGRRNTDVEVGGRK